MNLETVRNWLSSLARGWQRRWPHLRRLLRRGIPFYLAAAGTVLGIFLYTIFFPPPEPLITSDVDEIVTEALASVTPAPAYSSVVYQTILPSLVFIETRGPGLFDGNVAQAARGDELRPVGMRHQSQDPDGEEGQESLGIGGGVVVNDEGAILTALHVVAGAQVIGVTFADGTETTAEIVAAEPENDIAVLQAAQLPELFVPATLGNPNAMRIGDEAYAVGNPLGLAGSITAGVISGFDRSYESPYTGERLDGLIQFDAAVNPGNSGGPLLNRAGQVVGIVTGLINPTDQQFFIGIGLAVPIDTAGGAAGAPAQ